MLAQQDDVKLVTERILRWKPKDTLEYSVSLVLDDADFDRGPIDPDTGVPLRFRRIVRVLVESTSLRDSELNIAAFGMSAMQCSMVGPQSNRVFPMVGRVTEKDFSWTFTPNHVDPLPGSVSVPSLLTAGGNITIQASDTSASFTPTANSLLVIAWSARDPTNSTVPSFTYTTSLAGAGAFAAVGSSFLSGAIGANHQQARSQMGASPGSGTVTNTYGTAGCTRKAWVIAEVTGHNTTTPLSESGTSAGVATGTTASITLVGIAAGNLAVGTLYVRGNTPAVAPGAGETELSESFSGAGGGTGISTQMEYGTGNVVNWTWTGSNENAGVAIEYAQAAAPPGLGPSFAEPTERTQSASIWLNH